MQATEKTTKQIPQDRGVAVSGLASPIVMCAASQRSGERGKRPRVAGFLEPLVSDRAMRDCLAAATCPGQRGCAGICAQSSGIGESVRVISDLRQQSCARE
jgi:hypothetical protein